MGKGNRLRKGTLPSEASPISPAFALTDLNQNEKETMGEFKTEGGGRCSSS